MALQQSPYFKPTVPFSGPIYGGLKDGMTILVFGSVLKSCKRFRVDFQCGSCQMPRSDVAFHFNVRFDENCTVCNSHEKGSWQQEERKYDMVFRKGHPFEIRFLVNITSYVVLVDGKQYLEFKHRIPLSRVDTIGISGELDVVSISFQDPITYPVSSNPIFLIFSQDSCKMDERKRLRQRKDEQGFFGGPHKSLCQAIARRVERSSCHVPNTVPLQKIDKCKLWTVTRHQDIRQPMRGEQSSQCLDRLCRCHAAHSSGGSRFRCSPDLLVSMHPCRQCKRDERKRQRQDEQIWIQCEGHCFKVAVNGQHQFEYNNRTHNLLQINLLEVDGDIMLSNIQA